MASSNKTNFQRVISDIENYTFSREEQKFIDDHFGPTLTAKQIYGLYCRYHIHLKPDEIGEGFEKTRSNKPIITRKRGLPKSLQPILEPLNDKTDLKKRWSLLSKVIWWYKFVKHKDVDNEVWDIAEKLLALYPNGRKSVLINMVDSIKNRKVVVNEKRNDTNSVKEN